MEKTTGKIIKSQDVLCDGQYHLNMEQENRKSSHDHVNAAGVPNAHIIENNNEGAVIKVTCSCGQEISLQCYYENNN